MGSTSATACAVLVALFFSKSTCTRSYKYIDIGGDGDAYKELAEQGSENIVRNKHTNKQQAEASFGVTCESNGAGLVCASSCCKYILYSGDKTLVV